MATRHRAHSDRFLQVITRGCDFRHFVTDMVHAAVRVFGEERRNRRILAQRLKEFNFGIGDRNKRDSDAVLG
ncbi:hypothetical protein GGE07_005469 [Sinorhizobium terangae]|nr:hypothetical protein [Sinorhizobium terangae]